MTESIDRIAAALSDRYKIERELGQGGMATVYLAEDLKHDRKVAVKVLRPELAAVLGAERFVQEIKTTANLQHPHILPLFDSGEAESFLYYVMPYIEGETLRDKLNRETQLGIEDAVRITTEVADALDYAHRNNVIHRDIKPENILLHDGRPMVADFGIALAVSAAAGGRMTETGMSLGTPHYMSPEQATADKDLTNRSDIYSLGCVLYEMLTGEPPHTGSSAQQIVMRIVTDQARPVTELRKSVPPHVAAATAKSLEKLAADRFATAKEFAGALANPAFTLPTTQAAAGAGALPVGPWNRVTIAAVALAVFLFGTTLWGWLRPGPTPQPVVRHYVAFAEGQDLRGRFAISPDGSMWVYVGPGDNGTQLWLKRRSEHLANPLAGTDGALAPFFSPDGAWVGFVADRQIKKISVNGGVVSEVAGPANEDLAFGGTWLDDGTIVFIEPGWSLARVRDGGGPVERIVESGAFPALGASAAFVTSLPDGRGVLFTACSAGCAQSAVYVLDFRTGTRRLLIQGGLRAWYLPTGHLLYGSIDGRVYAVPFDLQHLEVEGAPVAMLDGVTILGFAVSGSGDLLYATGPEEGLEGRLEWIARDGTVQIVDSSWTGVFETVSLSPSGTRAAVAVGGEAGTDLWIKQLDRGPASRLTFTDGSDERAVWSADERTVMFVSERGGTRDLYMKRADGVGAAEVVLDLPEPVNSGQRSPDGEWLVYRTGVGSDLDIYARRLGGDTVTVPLVVSPDFNAYSGVLSRDGRWLAYVSDESGQAEVYVRPFPDGEGGRWQVSVRGGTEPLWAHNGRELFYKSGGDLVVVDFEADSTFSVGPERPLFPVQAYRTLNLYPYYDVAPDDQRFIMIRSQTSAVDPSTRLVLIQNFFEELEGRR
jgi:Tol biopolymer transport system component/tRNA A-37 threonylcarbamoyl transferase component Bud32